MMIFCFGKSRAVFYTGMALTAALVVTLACRCADGPLWLAAVTVALAAAVGTAVSALAANIAAASCESALLEKLHIALDPEEFIRLYEKPARAQKQGGAQRVVGMASLADGLCAAGKWREAVKTLESPGSSVPPRKRDALEGLVRRNRCRYLLSANRAKEAREALSSFRKQTETIRAHNARLAGNFDADAELYAAWLNLIEGGKADKARLEETMFRTPTKLAKLDLCQMLILAARNEGDAKEEERFSLMFIEEGGKLALAKELRRKYNAPQP